MNIQFASITWWCFLLYPLIYYRIGGNREIFSIETKLSFQLKLAKDEFIGEKKKEEEERISL